MEIITSAKTVQLNTFEPGRGNRSQMLGRLKSIRPNNTGGYPWLEVQFRRTPITANMSEEAGQAFLDVFERVAEYGILAPGPIGIRWIGNVPMCAGRIRPHPRRFTPGSITNSNHPVDWCLRKGLHVLWVKSAGFYASFLQEISSHRMQVRPRLHARTGDRHIAPHQRTEKGLGNLAPSRVPRTYKKDCSLS